jgi:hypothetical protein
MQLYAFIPTYLAMQSLNHPLPMNRHGGGCSGHPWVHNGEAWMLSEALRQQFLPISHCGFDNAAWSCMHFIPTYLAMQSLNHPLPMNRHEGGCSGHPLVHNGETWMLSEALRQQSLPISHCCFDNAACSCLHSSQHILQCSHSIIHCP